MKNCGKQFNATRFFEQLLFLSFLSLRTFASLRSLRLCERNYRISRAEGADERFSLHCSLLIAHCSLLIAHCSLLIAHCSLGNPANRPPLRPERPA